MGASEFTHETLEKLDPGELNVRKDLLRAHKLSGDTDARGKKKKKKGDFISSNAYRIIKVSASFSKKALCRKK